MAFAPLGILVRKRGGENMLRQSRKLMEETDDPDLKDLYMVTITKVQKMMEEDKDLTDAEVWEKYKNDPY
jgi:hypothetical protein